MLKIGEFANMNNVTVRALHHYEEVGILQPARTDEYTGYRYYNDGQSKDIRIINMLKELGFSLSEIAELINLSVEKQNLLLLLNEKYTQVRIDLGRAQFRSMGIERLMELVKAVPDDEKINIREIDDMVMFDGKKVIDHGKAYDWGFGEVFNKVREEGGDITMMVMDIDRFKAINDKYGRRIGDAILDAIFRQTVSTLPGGEGKINGYKSNLERVGGDEFIIRVDVGKADGSVLAEKIRRSIEDYAFNYLGIDEKVTVSIGVANMDSDPSDPEEFKHLAESAMYLAKHRGGNRVEEYTSDLKDNLNTRP